MPTRAVLRRHFRQVREALVEPVRRDASLIICEHLANHPRIHVGQTIAAYFALPNEANLAPWIAHHLDLGGDLVVPQLGTSQGSMSFRHYCEGMPLRTNKFGIKEPVDSPAMSAGDIDVMLVPLVAYDRAGTRLGMGGGYYDRFLAQNYAQIYTIGIAFACQQSAPLLPKAAWDVPLHAVATEKGVVEFDDSLHSS